MKYHFVVIFMCCIFLCPCASVFSESFTLTTYYPSPYGNYNELTTAGNTYLAADGGRVGIGTTDPNGFYKVDVEGGALAGIYSASVNSYGLVGSSDSNWGVVGQSLTNDGVRGTSGNGRGVYGQSLNNIGGYFESLNAGGYALITAGGNVGIGTNTPQQTLAVNGTIGVGPGMIPYDNSVDPGHQNPGLVLRAWQGASGGGDIILTDWPGEADAGDIVFTDGNGNQLGRVWSSNISGAMLNLTAHSAFGGVPSPDLSIDGIGNVYVNHNVGIGTPNPQCAMHIAGTSPWTLYDFPGWGVQAPVKFMVGAGNATGRFLSDGNVAVFIDDGNVSAGCTFVIAHNAMGFIAPAENLFLLDESTGITMKGGGTYTYADGKWNSVSDIAYKKNIIDLRYGLKEALRLQPREFDMKASGVHQIGFVAQEIEKVIPEVVSGKEGAKGLSYGDITAVLVNAIKEQQKEIEGLKAEIEKMKSPRN